MFQTSLKDLSLPQEFQILQNSVKQTKMSSSVDRDDELPLSCYKRKKKNFDYGSNVISDKKEVGENDLICRKKVK